MSRKGLIVALFVSLAVNLFAVGAVIGGLVVAKQMGEARERPRGGGPPLWAAARELSPEHRAAYARLLRGQGATAGEGMMEAQRLRAEAWRGLAAERPDVRQVKEALSEARTRDLAVRTGVENRIVDFAAGLPAAERARLAEALAQAPQRRMHRMERRGEPASLRGQAATPPDRLARPD